MSERWRPGASRGVLAMVLLLLFGAVAGMAQQARWGGNERFRSAALRDGTPERRGGFTFCRLRYTSVYREAGGLGWSTDYPGADHNIMVRLGQLTTTHTSRWLDGEPGYAVVHALDRELFECPFLFASDIGTAAFSEEEVAALRTYLLKGGMLWVDDFWGNRAWHNFERELDRILPGRRITELTPEHPLFDTFYTIPHVPQIPSIQFWRRSGGATSERGAESARPTLSAVLDDAGHIMVLLSHNTDIADGWEREQDDEDFFYRFTADGYGVGINVMIWAMTR